MDRIKLALQLVNRLQEHVPAEPFALILLRKRQTENNKTEPAHLQIVGRFVS